MLHTYINIYGLFLYRLHVPSIRCVLCILYTVYFLYSLYCGPSLNDVYIVCMWDMLLDRFKLAKPNSLCVSTDLGNKPDSDSDSGGQEGIFYIRPTFTAAQNQTTEKP